MRPPALRHAFFRLGPWILTLFVAALPACDCRTAKLATVCGVSVTPSTQDFGTVALNQAVTAPITLTNSGSAPLTVVSAVASGDDNFQVESLATSQIAPGTSVDIQVTFNPSTAGPHTATLLITTDDSCANPTSTVTLTGIGVSYGVTLSPASLDFGCVAANSQSTGQSVTLTNDSNPPSQETVTVMVSGSSDYQPSDSTTTFILDAGDSAQLSVVFAPQTVGTASAVWEIDACGGDAGCPPLPLQLSGIGSATVLVATPDAGDFGTVPEGETLSIGFLVQAEALPAGSDCAIAVSVEAPTLQFGDAGFALFLDAGWDGGFPATLAPPDTFPFYVTYTSETDGGAAAADTALVGYATVGQGQSSQSQLLVPLTAQSGSAPCDDLLVAPSSVSFGTVAMGQTVIRSVTISNPGSAVCEVSDVAITTNDAYAEFALGDGGTQPPFYLAPGGSQSAEVDVTFTTANVMAPLARNGRMTLTATEVGGSSTPPSLFQVPLSANVSSTVPGLGCSDGTREGFVSVSAYPSIAGCSGGWTIPSIYADAGCGMDAGNSSLNPNGVGCAAADLCSAGFHVCNSADDVAAHLPNGLDCTGITAVPGLFFATQQSGPGCSICSGANGQACNASLCGDDAPGSCVNDIYGCGTAGVAPDPTTCSVLTEGSNNGCGSLPPSWSCGTTGPNYTEATTVTKTDSDGGGVICCAN